VGGLAIDVDTRVAVLALDAMGAVVAVTSSIVVVGCGNFEGRVGKGAWESARGEREGGREKRAER